MGEREKEERKGSIGVLRRRPRRTKNKIDKREGRKAQEEQKKSRRRKRNIKMRVWDGGERPVEIWRTGLYSLTSHHRLVKTGEFFLINSPPLSSNLSSLSLSLTNRLFYNCGCWEYTVS